MKQDRDTCVLLKIYLSKHGMFIRVCVCIRLYGKTDEYLFACFGFVYARLCGKSVYKLSVT